MVHVRVDERLKAQAAETLASMNLTFFDAIRAFLIRVVASKWLPFAPKATHATNQVAVAGTDETSRSAALGFFLADRPKVKYNSTQQQTE
jgi:DNA-damage-inducible protein J